MIWNVEIFLFNQKMFRQYFNKILNFSLSRIGKKVYDKDISQAQITHQHKAS